MQLDLLISLVFAYVFSAISQVSRDLAKEIPLQPMWTMRPTIGRMVIAGATWFIRPYLRHSPYRVPKVRMLWQGTLTVIMHIGKICLLFFGILKLAGLITSSLAFRLPCSIIVFPAAAPIAIPLLDLASMPLMLALSYPVAKLFPDRRR